jgi:hypothetical protein
MKYTQTFESFIGKLVKQSQSHSVYQDPKHQDRLIKTGKDVLEHANVFKQNSEYCPIVYEVYEGDEPYIVIEKLETDKAIIDYERLINKDRGYVHNWGYNTFKNNKSFQTVKDTLTTEEGKQMFDRIREIVLAIGMKDIHARNFGYDKKGKLKAHDL